MTQEQELEAESELTSIPLLSVCMLYAHICMSEDWTDDFSFACIDCMHGAFCEAQRCVLHCRTKDVL